MKERHCKKSMGIVMATIKEEEEEDDEAIDRKIAESLAPKGQGLNAAGKQQRTHVKEADIQKYLQGSELTLSAKGHESESECDRNRKLAYQESQTKIIDVEKKEAAVDHKLEKLAEKEKKLEKRLVKCKTKEENIRRRDEGLREKVKILREEEKNLENEKQIIFGDREKLLNLKTEIYKMMAEVEEQQRKINEETEMLNRTEEERLKLIQLEELTILCREGCDLQRKLKNEIEEYRTQKELLVKENKEVRQVRKNLEEKQSEIDKDLTIITEQKQRFEELKRLEEESLKVKKQATLEHIEKELNALERSKRSFAFSMDSEKTVICERIQNARCQMLHEFTELKEQLENELQSKLKHESEQYRLQKELLTKESEQLKQERVNLDEKLSEIEKGLMDVNDQKEKLEKLKYSQEETLNQEKLATQEYIQRELDALEFSKEKIENERIQMLHEYKRHKRQCEDELHSKLKHETEVFRLQMELLLKESEDLGQRKKAFDLHWGELDKKQSQIQEQLIDLSDQKNKFEELKRSEEERLKQEKLAAEDYKLRELDAVKLSKEKIQNERSEMLHELNLWKTQLENEIERKREEMEKQINVREKLVEEREKEVNTIKYLKELVRGEMEEIRLERLKVEAHHFQMCKDINDLESHKRKLMAQLKQFVIDRENFASFLHKVKMLPVALGSDSAVCGFRNGISEMSNLPLVVVNETVLPIVLGSDSAVRGFRNGVSEMSNLPLVVVNETVLPIVLGSDSSVCSFRNGTWEMSNLSPVMVNEYSNRMVEIEPVHDRYGDHENDYVHKKQEVPKDLHASHLDNRESMVISAAIEDSKKIMGRALDQNQQKCLNSDADHLICMPSESHAVSCLKVEGQVTNGASDSTGRILLSGAKRSSKKRKRVTLDGSITDQNRDLTPLTLTDLNNGSDQEVSVTRKSTRQRRMSQVLEDYHLEYLV